MKVVETISYALDFVLFDIKVGAKAFYEVAPSWKCHNSDHVYTVEDVKGFDVWRSGITDFEIEADFCDWVEYLERETSAMAIFIGLWLYRKHYSIS